MKAEIKNSLHNKFEFRVIGKDGELKQEAVAYNLVTNNYYQRMNSFYSMSFDNVQLGTGTGTISITDTQLFSYLTEKGSGLSSYNIVYIGVNQFKVQSSVTFTESEAVGNLTEIGLGGQGLLYTHALITDSEGNPIAVNKTDTDRLIITITVFLTVSLPQSIAPFYGIGATSFSHYGDQKRYTNFSDDDIYYFVKHAIGCYSGWDGGTWNANVGLAVSPGGHTGCYNGGYDNLFSWGVTVNNTSTGVRIQNNGRALSADWNLPGTYQIYALNCALGHIPITSEIFTPLPLTLSEVADGTSTGFNFKVPKLSTEHIKVYIDDVLQSSSTYTWNGTDYVNTFQSWETTQADKLITNPAEYNSDYYNFGQTGSIIFNSYWHLNSAELWSTNTMTFDFQEQKTFTRSFKPVAGTTYTDWEYSNDNENWTTITIPSSDSNYYDFPTPIRARYLRAPNCFNRWDNSWTPENHTLLCCFSNQLEFNSPPSAGSIVKIEAVSEYPIKNSNWILDQFVIDFTISRG